MAANDTKHDESEITLVKIYVELRGMQRDFYKKIETIISEILVANCKDVKRELVIK